ncbi:MAG: hypothetical protein H6604_00780 [Flavobacteriales bacterium]|nr:hypothetical protein [Flavobacteriales bacterium]
MISRLYLLFNFVISTLAFSQESESTEHLMHDEEKSWELGLSNLYVDVGHPEEKVYGVDIHAIKSLSKHFGVGLGYAVIFEKHNSHEIIPLLSYKPIKRLLINAGPNFIIENHTGESEISAHFELEYLFRIFKKFKIGPTIETDLGKRNHYGGGLHLALEL